MDLESVLKAHPSVRLATSKDNQKILDFYERSALSGKSLKIRYSRNPNFFELLGCQSQTSLVLIYENLVDGLNQRVISGVATICLRTGFIGGKLRQVAYLGDLRISLNRKLIVLWRKIYADLLLALDSPMITAVIDENEAAQRALISQNRSDFLYQELTAYRMVNVIRKLRPLVIKRKFQVKVSRATREDYSELEAFLLKQNLGKAFGYPEEELRRRLIAWKGFSLESFFIARRDGMGIVGCFAPWDPAYARSHWIEALPWTLKLLRLVSRIPENGQMLKTIYLTHLELSESLTNEEMLDIFGALFDQFFKEYSKSDWHMISFCDFESMKLRGALSNYLTQTIPMKLYTVRHRNQEPIQLSHKEAAAPGFEIALV